jgi:ATP-binding cassette, subfamily B (MDR/TAP), member 1
MSRKGSKDDQSSSELGDVVQKAEPDNAGFSSYWRIFSYTDKFGWLLNVISLLAAITSGALLPLMNLIFGRTVTTFNDFLVGRIGGAEFRSKSSTWA